MTASMFRPSALGFCALVVGLSGCNAAGDGPEVATVAAIRSSQRAASKGSTDTALLYVSDSSQIGEHNGVSVYSFPHGQFCRDQKHFAVVGGMCTDAAQHLYVTYTDLYQIQEYKHGGTRPIKILEDPSGTPADCSVDPTTGNLAVSNSGSLGGQS